MKLSSQLSIQKFIFLLLFFSCTGMLAWLSIHYNQQFDLTANKRHSLSSNSIELLQTLDKEVSIHAYTKDDVTKQAIQEIISRYQRIKPDFSLQLLNPDIEIEQVKEDGVVMDKPFAFVVYYNHRKEQIDSLAEQSISNALLRLSRRDNQEVVFLSGHGERSLNESNDRAYNTLKKNLHDTGFNLQTINLLENPLPATTKLIVIAAPTNHYLDGEIEQLQRYIDNGGNLLWMSEPGELAGLDEIASSLGLQLQDGIIIDNDADLRKTLNIPHPAIIPVTTYLPHIITKTIRYNTLFPLSRGISPLTNKNSVNNWQAEALFTSSAKSWGEAGGLSEEMVFNSASGDVAGPITIAVALHRDNTQTKGSQRMVVVGDSDFLSDGYIGAGANLNLGLNIFNWLIGDDDLISVEVPVVADTKLELNDQQLAIIGFGFFLIIPILLLLIGFRIWYVRRNK